MEKLKTQKEYFGMPLYLLLGTSVVVLIATYFGTLPKDLVGGFALMFAIGMILNEIGDRIPIWNEYVGGGLVLTFLGSAALVYYKLIPEDYVGAMNTIMDDQDFLTFFIIVLITGSILGLDRKLLIKSFVGYIPAILGGLVGAFILGILGGLLFGINPAEVALKYVLPIMGGGNGGGAVPLSQMYETVTGRPKAEYYAFAIAILTIANIFAIITAAVLNKIGKIKPELTGDGKTLMRKSSEIQVEEKSVKATMKNIGAGLVVTLAFYALGGLFAGKIFPKIFGVAIHRLAYTIIFVALANALGLIPDEVRAGTKKLQSFFTAAFIVVIMVGVGVDTDLADLINAITFTNVIMAGLIVVGAILGSAMMGYVVGFYPIDSAVTAGLCMANRGGSGDLAVLGAANRMDLMSYAQLSSRLGGGLVLIIASILFGKLL